jgi:ferrous iron transport protein A
MMQLTSLAFVKEGDSVLIHSIKGGIKIKKRLEEIGLIPGKELNILKAGPGPVVIKLQSSKIALGFGEALKIMVSKKK